MRTETAKTEPYAKRSLSEYLSDAASGQPTPGGGSVAALAAALAAAMSGMVAEFTTGREKYLDVQAELDQLLPALKEHRNRLLGCVDEDVLAYGEVSKAYKMPKNTKEERAERSQAIAEASRTALSVPMDVARECLQIARIASRLSEIGNPQLITDAGVSALLCLASAQSAALNVEINLSGTKDPSFCEIVRKELGQILSEVGSLRDKVWEKVIQDIDFDGSSVLR